MLLETELEEMALFRLAAAAALSASTDAGASVLIDMYSDAQCPCSAPRADCLRLCDFQSAGPPHRAARGGLAARDVTGGVAHRRGRCSKFSGYAVALA